jgi:hypothetical protein
MLISRSKELWSFSVEYDLRVVFYFVNDSEVILEDIGSHDEVYNTIQILFPLKIRRSFFYKCFHALFLILGGEGQIEILAFEL